MSITTYSATGELNIRRDSVTQGTRVLLTCDVTGLPEVSEDVSYRWYHNCTGHPTALCELNDRDPYYRVEKAALLVDITSLDQGGWYYCRVSSLQGSQVAVTREQVAG